MQSYTYVEYQLTRKVILLCFFVILRNIFNATFTLVSIFYLKINIFFNNIARLLNIYYFSSNLFTVYFFETSTTWNNSIKKTHPWPKSINKVCITSQMFDAWRKHFGNKVICKLKRKLSTSKMYFNDWNRIITLKIISYREIAKTRN